MTKPGGPGAQEEVFEFSEQKFNEVRQSLSAATTVSAAEITTLEEMTKSGGEMTAQAECIGVTIKNGQVCLKLPMVGTVCLPVGLPDGTAAQACISLICHWAISYPRVSIRVGGIEVVAKSFSPY
jgi:hypothetical protein